MTFPIFIVILGSAIGWIGSAAYLRDTLAGRTKPHRVTFLIWGTAPLIGVAASFANGVRWAALPVLMTGLAPALIFLASFHNKNARWEIRPFDYICGAFSILALMLWGLTHEPDIAILFAILSDALAALPTMRKAWTHPETETPLAYATSLISVLTSFVVMPEFTFSACAFPVYLLGCNSIILLVLGRKKLGHAKT